MCPLRGLSPLCPCRAQHLTETSLRQYLPVLYLLLKVASAVGMGLVLKHADARSLERIPLIRANYAVAAVIGFFASVALGQTRISTPSLLLAAGTGVLFVAGLLIWTQAIQAAGLALSVVAMRTAVVVPLLAAAIIWRERPSALEFIGSAVALLALALVLSEASRRKGGDITGLPHNPDRVPSPADSTTNTQRPEEFDNSRPGIRHSTFGNSSFLWLLLLFLTDGLVMVPALVFRKEMPLSETMPFQTIIFVAAFFVTTLLYYLRRPRGRDMTAKTGTVPQRVRRSGSEGLSPAYAPDRVPGPGTSPATLRWGALLGTTNFGNYLFLVLALSVLPGLVVYPVIAAGEVGLTAVAGVALWKEKVGVRSWLGIALAVLALVLIQLGKSAGA